MDLDQTQAIYLNDSGDETDVEQDPGDKKPAAYLKVLSQKGLPQTEFPLYEGDNVIGRQHDVCNICIPIKALSKQHACIEIRGESHIIYDKGSRNKTKMGKLYLSPDVRYGLREGDTLWFGNVNCIYKQYLEEEEDHDGSTSEMDSDCMFHTAQVNGFMDLPTYKAQGEIIDEDESSNASSNLLQPTQLCGADLGEKARKERLDEAATLMFAEDSDISDAETSNYRRKKKSITLAETPAVTRRAFSEETSPATMAAASDKEESGGNEHLLAAPTQAYVMESDVEDKEESDDNEDLLAAPTQAYDLESDVEDKEESDGNVHLLAAPTQAYDLESDVEDKEESDGNEHLLAAPTQAYDLGSDVEDKEESGGNEHLLAAPTQAYDLGSDVEDKEESDGNVHLLAAPTQAYVMESDVEDEEDDKEKSDSYLLGAPTQMFDEGVDNFTLAYDVTMDEGTEGFSEKTQSLDQSSESSSVETSGVSEVKTDDKPETSTRSGRDAEAASDVTTSNKTTQSQAREAKPKKSKTSNITNAVKTAEEIVNEEENSASAETLDLSENLEQTAEQGPTSEATTQSRTSVCFDIGSAIALEQPAVLASDCDFKVASEESANQQPKDKETMEENNNGGDSVKYKASPLKRKSGRVKKTSNIKSAVKTAEENVNEEENSASAETLDLSEDLEQTAEQGPTSEATTQSRTSVGFDIGSTIALEQPAVLASDCDFKVASEESAKQQPKDKETMEENNNGGDSVIYKASPLKRKSGRVKKTSNIKNAVKTAEETVNEEENSASAETLDLSEDLEQTAEQGPTPEATTQKAEEETGNELKRISGAFTIAEAIQSTSPNIASCDFIVPVKKGRRGGRLQRRATTSSSAERAQQSEEEFQAPAPSRRNRRSDTGETRDESVSEPAVCQIRTSNRRRKGVKINPQDADHSNTCSSIEPPKTTTHRGITAETEEGKVESETESAEPAGKRSKESVSDNEAEVTNENPKTTPSKTGKRSTRKSNAAKLKKSDANETESAEPRQKRIKESASDNEAEVTNENPKMTPSKTGKRSTRKTIAAKLKKSDANETESAEPLQKRIKESASDNEAEVTNENPKTTPSKTGKRSVRNTNAARLKKSAENETESAEPALKRSKESASDNEAEVTNKNPKTAPSKTGKRSVRNTNAARLKKSAENETESAEPALKRSKESASDNEAEVTNENPKMTPSKTGKRSVRNTNAARLKKSAENETESAIPAGKISKESTSDNEAEVTNENPKTTPSKTGKRSTRNTIAARLKKSDANETESAEPALKRSKESASDNEAEVTIDNPKTTPSKTGKRSTRKSNAAKLKKSEDIKENTSETSERHKVELAELESTSMGPPQTPPRQVRGRSKQTGLKGSNSSAAETTQEGAENPYRKRKSIKEEVFEPLHRSPVTDEEEPILNSPNTRRKSVTPKPRVAFTGVVDKHGQKITKDLGGQCVDCVYDCTHLVTDQVRRTVKFLCCLARGLPIVVTQWLHSSKDAGCFIDPIPYLVPDKANEKKFKFSLHGSIQKASASCLLPGYKIHVTKNVLPDPPQMKDIIQCAGAEYSTKMPNHFEENCVVISCEEDKGLCQPALNVGIPVVSSEFILTGVLRQEILTDTFRLFLEETGKGNKQISTPTRASRAKKSRK